MTAVPQQFRILNVSLDRDLLDPSGSTETQRRQEIYAREIPARIVHLVKAPAGHSPDALDLADGRVQVVPCRVRHWSLFPMAAVARGIALARRERFDLVYVQEPVVSGAAGAYLARRLGLPLVAGVFGDEIDNPAWLRESWINRVANRVGKGILRQAAVVRTDSAALAERLRILGVRRAEFIPFLITNADLLSAPQPGASEVRERLLEGRSGPLLLAVLRLEAVKNVSLMLRAFGEISERHPGAILAVVGDGSLRSELEAEAAHVAPGRVRWLGWIANQELPAVYQAADLLLLSSNSESSARVLTEAHLAGVPVLSTDTAGTREVVENGSSGRVVPVGDVESFAAALADLCADPDRLREMGACGQARMMSSKEEVVDGLRRLYGAAVQGAA